MKKILLFIVMILSFGCSAQEKRISKIEVKKVSFLTSTLISIKCDKFESSFEEEEIEKHSVIDNDKLEKLSTLLFSLKIDEKGNSVDTREKIIIFYSDNSKTTLCIDYFGLILNGNIMRIDKKDLEFLHNL